MLNYTLVFIEYKGSNVNSLMAIPRLNLTQALKLETYSYEEKGGGGSSQQHEGIPAEFPLHQLLEREGKREESSYTASVYPNDECVY